MNIAINARDAMPKGGKLTLETANVSFDRARAGHYPELKPGDIGHVDLLFTDVVLPHTSGKELADRVRVLYPHIRILFARAHTGNGIAHQGVLNEGVALLQKPFTPSALARKVREVLDQPSDPKSSLSSDPAHSRAFR